MFPTWGDISIENENENVFELKLKNDTKSLLKFFDLLLKTGTDTSFWKIEIWWPKNNDWYITHTVPIAICDEKLMCYVSWTKEHIKFIKELISRFNLKLNFNSPLYPHIDRHGYIVQTSENVIKTILDKFTMTHKWSKMTLQACKYGALSAAAQNLRFTSDDRKMLARHRKDTTMRYEKHSNLIKIQYPKWLAKQAKLEYEKWFSDSLYLLQNFI